MVVVHDGVFIDPSRASGIRADGGVNARGQAPSICCMYSSTRERAQ